MEFLRRDVIFPIEQAIQVLDWMGLGNGGQVNATSVPLSALAKGVYLLNITNEKGVQLKVEKLVKAE